MQMRQAMQEAEAIRSLAQLPALIRDFKVLRADFNRLVGFVDRIRGKFMGQAPSFNNF